MKFHALLNLYNDRTFLGACLDSLIGAVDSVIVADGAYKLYYEEYKHYDPTAKPWSTDGSLETLMAFRGLPDLKIIKPPTPEPNAGLDSDCWENQSVKRTALIDAVPEGDWFLIIDADEMLMGDVQEGMEKIYESGCICASTPLWLPGTHEERLKMDWHPRIFKKLLGMKYKGTHWHLRDKFDRIIEDKYPRYWTDVIVLVHFKPFKKQERQIPHQNYMNQLGVRGWLEPTDLGKVLMKSEL